MEQTTCKTLDQMNSEPRGTASASELIVQFHLCLGVRCDHSVDQTHHAKREAGFVPALGARSVRAT